MKDFELIRNYQNRDILEKMKKSKKKKRTAESKKGKNLKMSEMILDYAADFIELGDTIDQKQSYLNTACVAWNISLMTEKKRQKAVKQFIEQYKADNPGIEDTQSVRHDVELLIKEKLRLYPNEKRSIMTAKITDDGDKERIIIASVPL